MEQAEKVALSANRVRRRIMSLGIGLAVVVFAIPFVLNVAGDAQVHLAIAENFVRGRPFQYNPSGEIVVASTSPFWTVMLIVFYLAAGSLAPLLLTGAGAITWLITAALLYRAANELWHFPAPAVWLTLLLWLLHSTIVANALGGLENVLSALQLLILYMLTASYLDGLSAGRSLLLGLVLGWALLTRPDGGLFALFLTSLFLLALWPIGRRYPRKFAAQLAIIGGAAIVVLLPWYIYQFSETGRLVTDSSIARLYNGRQGSLTLIPGFLYLHPKALVSLGTAFLPLLGGFLLSGYGLAKSFAQATSGRMQQYRGDYARYAALLLVLAGLFFYTFVVGAEAFGRYFLPIFPFFFLAGIDGWTVLYRWLEAHGWRTAALTLVATAVFFVISTSLFDTYRRLGPGRFEASRVADVIYGPANRRYFSFNLPDILEAPAARRVNSDELAAFLDTKGQDDLSIAVTEVQLRYFLDERFQIISLDGRTSADILDYVNPATGAPDFERYFLDVQPDYVHANQWCAVGGWLSDFFTSEIGENLVCAWEKTVDTMQPGDSFQWQGHRVTLAAPEILHIDWQSGS